MISFDITVINDNKSIYRMSYIDTIYRLFITQATLIVDRNVYLTRPTSVGLLFVVSNVRLNFFVVNKFVITSQLLITTTFVYFNKLVCRMNTLIYQRYTIYCD